MNSIRREKIREYVERRQVVTVEELRALLPEVSLMTIHRDLTFLQGLGVVEKVRGGARYLTGGAAEPAFSAREIVNKEAKEQIAEKAVGLLGETDGIFLDAGTTMMTFVRRMPDLALNIVTTGPNIALELAKKQHPVVSMCGGTLNKSNLTLSGSAAEETVARINIDTAFLVASGCSPEGGFTCGRDSEARIKSLVAAKARRTVMLMDSSKFGRMLPYTFAGLEELDLLITDQDPAALPPWLRDASQAAGTALL